jgi:hypothetical protein
MGRRAMSEEPLAVSRISPAPAAQTDYDAICAALMHTERGRWFLDEYAKRNRSADTKLLLTAIERIETVVSAERNKQVQQGFRTDLLEMAQAITRTRAEVAEIRAEGVSAPAPARDNGHAAQSPRPRDIFAAAERIRDVTWAMRGHGFDPTTCDQLEELAGTILSASALRDPTDHRASKLSEVLQYLERRIDGLLESCSDGGDGELELETEPQLGFEPELGFEPDRKAAAPPPSREPRHANGFASHMAEPVTAQVTEPCELDDDFEAEPASPLAPATDPGGALPAARIEIEELESEDFALAAVEVATDVIEIAAVETVALAADTPAVAAATGGAEPVPATVEPASSDPVAPEPIAVATGATAKLTAGTEPPAPDLAAKAPAGPPTVGPINSDQLLPRWPDLNTTAAAARLFLPDLEMHFDLPGRAAAWAGTTPQAAATPKATAAPAVVAPQPGTAANGQALQADPLAGLKAMSENELIALFS